MTQVSDKFLARLITITVCCMGLILTATLALSDVKGYNSDGGLKELTFLIAGGLLSQVTTRGNKDEPKNTQQISVPDPLPTAEEKIEL